MNAFISAINDLHIKEGLSIIPIKGQAPRYDDWNIFCERLPTEDEIENFSKKPLYFGTNAGLCLGPASGVIALDIDIIDRKEFEEKQKLFPQSPISKFGMKGETRFFKYNGEKSRKNNSKSLELLSTGNQTVVPPSVHPKIDRPYVWVRRDCKFSELPDLPREFYTEYFENQTNTPLEKSVTPSDGTRCNHGSHNTLSSVLVAMIESGSSFVEIYSRLMEVDAEINKTISYFVCPSRNWKSKDPNLNCSAFIAEASGKRNMILTPKTHELVIVEPVVDIKKSFTDYKEKKLPMFRGALQTIFQYCYQNSPVQRTRFSVAATLAAVGGFLGNVIHSGGYSPNFFVMILGPSRCGKDFPLKFPEKLFQELGLEHLIGRTAGSSSGIIANMADYDTRVDRYDEGSTLFKLATDTKNIWASSMANTYCELDSSSGPSKIFLGKTLKNDKDSVKKIKSPCISVILATTIAAFQSGFSSSLMQEGLGRRFIYFADFEQRYSEDRDYIPLDSNVAMAIKNIHSRRVGLNSLNDYNRKSVKVEMNHDAKKLWDKIRKSNEFNANPNSIIEPLITSGLDHVRKFALIDSWATQYESPVEEIEIKPDNLDWAMNMALGIRDSHISFFEENFMTDMDPKTKRLLDFIASSGENGVSRRDILRKFTTSIQDIGKNIRALLESERVIEKTVQTQGCPPSVRLYHT